MSVNINQNWDGLFSKDTFKVLPKFETIEDAIMHGFVEKKEITSYYRGTPEFKITHFVCVRAFKCSKFEHKPTEQVCFPFVQRLSF